MAQTFADKNTEVRKFELEKRFNTMELHLQRQLQQRDREIAELKIRMAALESGRCGGCPTLAP
ncbi:hypothetical protein FGU65_09245 [Methanoculleus sp. FWC-SCC1]|uniref:Uncharacterized protein n=1 Tax=Methanoculleus frigidifontis TaxID=2584085 RepID=A0ABT8MAV1_9EURY|nr:hypothetical protein [Methanoculleus sp. FWC-SCC1]MDN7025069.1 hypothetical protein [Methanoculleus sp. FWC-SCC1]